MTARRIKVLLVDDHAIVREGYRSLLEKQVRIEVVGEAADGDEACAAVRALDPDVVVMDLSMPGSGGLDALARIRERFPDVRLLVFSMHENAAFAVQAVRAGAKGYVTKSSPPDVLIRSIYEVHDGRQALSPDIARSLALSRLGDERGPLDELTVREFEILRMLAEAQPVEHIARALHLSTKTVQNCHYQIKKKLGAANDIELVRLAIRLAVVDLTELSGPHS